jgi:hypothetical protein
MATRGRNIGERWCYKRQLRLTFDQRLSLSPKDHQGFFVLTRRVPADRLTRFQADEPAPHLLSRDQDAPIPGEGHAGESVGGSAKHRASGCAAASRRTSSSVRTSGSVNWRGRNLLLTVTAEAHCPSLAGGLQMRSHSRYPRHRQRADQWRRHYDQGTFA